MPAELALEAVPAPSWKPRPPTGKVLVTGAAGVVASHLLPALTSTHGVIGVDSTPIPELGGIESYVGNANSRSVLEPLIAQVDSIIHLPTGAWGGWQGLMDTEVNGTKMLLELAVDHGIHRTIIASSNHVLGWYERLAAEGEPLTPVTPHTAARVDGAYGAAKAFAENLAQLASDWYGLPVSILRLGTMRRDPITLEDVIASDELPYLGNGEFRRDRLTRSWLTGPDLVHIMKEELQATDVFRMRFATSSPDQEAWDHTILSR